MKIDLSPQCVESIQYLQENVEMYQVMIEDTCDYIIECTDTLDEECRPSAAITILRALRDLKKVITKLNGEE